MSLPPPSVSVRGWVVSLESGVSRSICRRVERANGPNSVALPAGVGFGKDALRKKRADLFGLFVEL